MLLRVRKQLPSSLRATSNATTVATSCSLHLRALLLSTSASSTTPFAVEDYLVATCGLTRAQALKASKKLLHPGLASKADAVVALLSGAGLSRPDIAAAVASDPLLLRARVGNIGPRLSFLRDRYGLSAPQIARFLQVGAQAFRSCDIAPKLEFWIPFLGSMDKLLQTLRRNRNFLASNIEKVVKPNIVLLEQCGISVCDIVKLLTGSSWLLLFNPERVKEFVLRADQLGTPRSSMAFKQAVGIVCCISEDKIAAKMELLRSTLGCSMEKIRDAVRMHPRVLKVSEEKLLCRIQLLGSTLGCSNDKVGIAVLKRPDVLRFHEETLHRKIDFLLSEAGLEPEYIVEKPMILTHSIEKWMVPRHFVVKMLQKNGLLPKSLGFRQLVHYSDKRFVRRIGPLMDTVPGLSDFYATACAGENPAKVHL